MDGCNWNIDYKQIQIDRLVETLDQTKKERDELQNQFSAAMEVIEEAGLMKRFEEILK